MKLQIVFGLSLLFATVSASVIVLQDDEDKAVERITQLIEQLTRDGSVRNPAAKLLRLVVQDCLGGGGCNGCINPIYQGTSKGLRDIFAHINNIYDTEGYNRTGMSRADFIALAGVAAVRQASSLQTCTTPNCVIPTPDITIKYGRIDCSTAPITNLEAVSPSAHGDLKYVLDLFKDNFNMTARQTVAIMGVHTLGDAGIERSGYRGPWVPATTVFDNKFYQELVNNAGWYQEEINDTRSPSYPAESYQWTLDRPGGSESLMMLNTDVALWKDIQPDDDGQETVTACRNELRDCSASETADIVMEFANSNEAFHEAFGPAYEILVERLTPPNLTPAASGAVCSLSAISVIISLVLLALYNTA